MVRFWSVAIEILVSRDDVCQEFALGAASGRRDRALPLMSWRLRARIGCSTRRYLERYGPSIVLISVTGDLIGRGGPQSGVEIWRVPFMGWDEARHMEATRWCRPRRFAILDGSNLRACGDTASPVVPRGEIFTLRVERPPSSTLDGVESMLRGGGASGSPVASGPEVL